MGVKSRARWIIGDALAVAGICGLLGWVYLTTRYVQELPTRPIIADGHVVQLDVHGARVYMTRKQAHVRNALFFGSIVVAATGGAIGAPRCWRSR